MWGRSASFLLEKRQGFYPDSATTDANPNPSSGGNGVSAYYQTRADHHAVVNSDWLAQAEAAVDRDAFLSSGRPPASSSSVPFSVIDEFNHWRKKPDLAEAVAAIMALSAVIRSSEATTMMELEIELNKASDTLKGGFNYL
ncbi:uncharacterized protein LOC141811554 [Curcuma longa]|uniref:uncharacterized protein LOC141811554 n=1 Tax=Curcuma longa TaxID=136217 RepID=UPI003D9E367E